MIHPAAAQAIQGTLELFLGRRDGMKRFDFSVEGFWQSFRAALYVLPLAAANAAVEHGLLLSEAALPDRSDASFIAARIVDFGLDWITMPILLALFASQLGIGKTFAPYIVLRNWTSILMAAPQTLISLLVGLGVLSLEFGAVLSLAVLGVMLRFHYQIIGLTLGKSVGFKIALVAADVVLSLVLDKAIDRIFGL
jgi:hypothetical protein